MQYVVPARNRTENNSSEDRLRQQEKSLQLLHVRKQVNQLHLGHGSVNVLLRVYMPPPSLPSSHATPPPPPPPRPRSPTTATCIHTDDNPAVDRCAPSLSSEIILRGSPADTQHCDKVASTSMQCHDVESTFMRRCVDDMCRWVSC